MRRHFGSCQPDVVSSRQLSPHAQAAYVHSLGRLERFALVERSWPIPLAGYAEAAQPYAWSPKSPDQTVRKLHRFIDGLLVVNALDDF